MFGKGSLVRSIRSNIICLVVAENKDKKYPHDFETRVLQVVQGDENFTDFPVGTKYEVQTTAMEKCYIAAK
jgi:hypothetical protein